MSAIKQDHLFTADKLAHICSDEGVRVDLFNRASKFTTVAIDGFKSTIDSANRARDAEVVANTLGIPEKGKENIEFTAQSKESLHLATGYNRVVYGDHGPYLNLVSII